jgi:hypothetical protein
MRSDLCAGSYTLRAIFRRLPLSFRFWRLEGTWERMHAALRQRVRVRLKSNPQPSAAIVDSQGRSRPQACAAKSAVTTEPRRSKEESAICWWTRRGW